MTRQEPEKTDEEALREQITADSDRAFDEYVTKRNLRFPLGEHQVRWLYLQAFILGVAVQSEGAYGLIEKKVVVS